MAHLAHWTCCRGAINYLESNFQSSAAISFIMLSMKLIDLPAFIQSSAVSTVQFYPVHCSTVKYFVSSFH